MNKDKENISEELLNAFVDEQLTHEDKNEIYESTLNDKELSDEVCQLRKISGLVRLAYEEIPLPEKGSPSTRRRTRIKGVAASIAAGLTLVMGLVLGWNAKTTIQDNGVADANTYATLPANAGYSGYDDTPEIKVVFHLKSGNNEKIKEALDEAENLLNHFRETKTRAWVEVVTNSGGLKLLRADISPFADRVVAMQKNYTNLNFVACANALGRLKREKGIDAQLLPGTIVIDSGVAQLMRRQHQGWAYIQV